MMSFHKIQNFEVFLNSKKRRGSVLFLANTTINIVDASLLFCFLSETTQIENPRTQWRQEQERMLKEYLVVAQEALNAKKEMYLVKQQRLELAQQEMLRLDELSGDNHSITSTFSGSSSSAKYDPDQIKVEIACKRERDIVPLAWGLRRTRVRSSSKGQAKDRPRTQWARAKYHGNWGGSYSRYETRTSLMEPNSLWQKVVYLDSE
ncbi:hypothetical protein AMECASPLE_023274 [Ameca splendens]|uniref:Uncharacterized protein n=1 Tax=Ameca splendens TaxID=208324 RepID=A0ABV0XSZ9_9TELE